MINLPKTTAQNPSIFKKPLTGVAKGPQDHAERLRVKNLHMAYGYLVLAALLLSVYSFFFLYPQTLAFLEAPPKLAALDEQIQQYEKSQLPNLEEARNLKRAAYESELSEVESNLDKIFPPTVDKLGLVRRLENFATVIHAKNPPFEFNAITLGKPTEEPSYVILPISTSIQSSQANFDRFLELINLSGHLDAEVPIRLMEISNIDIRYRGVDSRTGKDKGVDFNVKLNAYSRPVHN